MKVKLTGEDYEELSVAPKAVPAIRKNRRAFEVVWAQFNRACAPPKRETATVAHPRDENFPMEPAALEAQDISGPPSCIPPSISRHRR